MTTKQSSKIPASLTQISMQQLFQVWQNLANEATGHDTEWDYPISIDRIVQELKSTKRGLIRQLMQQHGASVELLAQEAAITFHSPI